MENYLKRICSFLTDLTKLDEVTRNNRLSSTEVRSLLGYVDVKRKGFLDLGDVYDLVGKIGEEELFTVFKFLDQNRTGQIRFEELVSALGDPNSQSHQTGKEYIFPRFYAIVDSIKDRPKLVAQAKAKIGLNQNQLRDVYRFLCEMVQSKYLANGELVTVLKAQSMKYGLTWGYGQQKALNELFGGQSVTQVKFVECFNQGQREDLEEENLLSGIQDYSPKVEKVIKNEKIALQNSEYRSQGLTSSKYSKSRNIVQTVDTPSFRNQGNELDYPKTSKQFEKIQGNINGVLSTIQQRRQRLRNDSLQRKKIIEEVMNRKKQLCGFERSGVRSPKVNLQREWDSSKWTAKDKYQGYFNHNQGSRLNSSPKESIYPEYQQKRSVSPYGIEKNNYLMQHYQTSPGLSPHKYNIERQSEHQNFSSYERMRPSTPTNNFHQQNLNINDILKKYNTNIGPKVDDDVSTLKQLCRSKSGVLYSQVPSGYKPYPSTKNNTEFTTQNWESKWHGREQNSYNSRSRQASKENVMKRAQEQAARKIEEIERKARMKVLEKKNILSRNEGRDWRGLTKKGVYY